MGTDEIKKETINDHTVLINPGKVIDNNNAHEMIDIISEAQGNGYNYIILDMSDMEFISSAGVGSILGTIETSREAGGDIIICNASENIIHIFDVLDLTDYLTVEKDRERALAVCLAGK